MNNLPKQILNYFATFTETRFNFRRSINYKWTNNELTLDLSLFPDFQRELLSRIKSADLTPVIIKPEEYKILVPKDNILAQIETLMQSKFDETYLDKCIADEYALVIEQNPLFTAGENGEVKLAEESEEGKQLLSRQITLAQKEGIRIFCLELRRKFEQSLNKLQEIIVEQKKVELNIQHIPASIFGVAGYVNNHFEKIKQFGSHYSASEIFIKEVTGYFADVIEDIVIYDLFFNLQNYANYFLQGTLYIFFHTLEKENEAYPLYFIEIECRTSGTEVTLTFPRKLILLNTPAINYFKYESVLTVPRASAIETAPNHLGAIETFMQAQYGFQYPFILEPSFNLASHENIDFPQIKNRIGLQIVTNEDKKLLDYSELMTKMEMGETSRFSEFVDQYVKGTVPNFQEEVDQVFLDNYSLKKPARYVSNSPISINNSQKRILLALANEKNHIIVVDGPPGTGKSHTIAALTYWANEHNKSVVVTSHKQEALDVIDRMLTEKFKGLHPQSKPSIVRLDKDTSSANNLQNTLTAAVVGAANDRVLNYNEPATEKDEKRLTGEIIETIADKLNQSENYQEMIQNVIQFEILDQELFNILATNITSDQAVSFLASDPKKTNSVYENITSIQIVDGQVIDFEKITAFINSGALRMLSDTSLEELDFLIEQKDRIPVFMEACEKLNKVPEDILNIDENLVDIPVNFSELLENLNKHFKHDVQISEITTKDITTGLFQKMLGKAPKEEELKSLLSQLNGLKFANIVREIAKILDIEYGQVTIGHLSCGAEKIRFAISMRKYQVLLSSYWALPGNKNKGVSDIHEVFRKYEEIKNLITEEIYQSLKSLFDVYGQLLNHFEISKKQLGTLTPLIGQDEKLHIVWRWIQLHYVLSQTANMSPVDMRNIQDYYRLKQKDVEHLNDHRLKNLNNHLGEMARIKVSYEGGKRFSLDEVRVLLECVSCVIAEPGTLSKHFPMEEGLIDILIIDEASQVSIADAISLILRAKQVVIFGDEYQYGAVSATNVSTKYSASYFSEIITAYTDDYSASVSEAAKAELVDEISKEVPPDEQLSDDLLKPQDGTVLWLKTFNIRTSTLTFAKAIANYTSSLKEHFRSFPEIIGYSNDFFYKVAQMELVVNRIRTKPIGEVLQFVKVETRGLTAPNTNLDEIDTIIEDIQKRVADGFKGTIGIITSFKEQQERMEQAINEKLNMTIMKRVHKLVVWFVGEVQGEERDIVYYSFVEDKNLKNANLASIYPVVGGTADTIRSLKMQRLNVGFSRAKDTMVFVHSQPIEKFSNTRLGDALKFYLMTLEANKKSDFFVEDEAIFGSEMEKKLYRLLLETQFVKSHRDHIKIIPQFDIGKYIAAEHKTAIPKYRTDFLLTYARGGKEQTLILEYDGVEYHFKNPQDVNRLNFSQEYLDYDVSRQLELESYGYRFLRINKFNLRPKAKDETEADVLNAFLEGKFQTHA
ncbi:MAG: AAA domain-containing protein [Pelolinea sp.]|nr:AAA domain-containing protein [Pelolinea sp.]